MASVSIQFPFASFSFASVYPLFAIHQCIPHNGKTCLTSSRLRPLPQHLFILLENVPEYKMLEKKIIQWMRTNIDTYVEYIRHLPKKIIAHLWWNVQWERSEINWIRLFLVLYLDVSRERSIFPGAMSIYHLLERKFISESLTDCIFPLIYHFI